MNDSVKALLLLAAMVGGVYYLSKEQDEDESNDDFKILPKPRPKRKNYIKGGKGDNLRVKDVSKRELKRGIEVELEHTKSRKIAKEIAMDHLTEIPDYYTRLKKMEKEGEAKWKKREKKLNESLKDYIGDLLRMNLND